MNFNDCLHGFPAFSLKTATTLLYLRHVIGVLCAPGKPTVAHAPAAVEGALRNALHSRLHYWRLIAPHLSGARRRFAGPLHSPHSKNFGSGASLRDNGPIAMDTAIAHLPQDGLPLEQQVARLQALLEATRQVHSAVQVEEILTQAASILVRELEMEGALFLSPAAPEPIATWGSVPNAPYKDCPRYPLLSKEHRLLAELIVAPAANGEFSLYDQDFIEGLVLQTAVALENATMHERDLEWVRVQQDLNAARSIQRSLLPRGPRELPYLAVTGVQLPCHAVGGDYFDVFPIDDDHTAILIADVSGKGLGAALLATMIQGALSGMTMGADPARLFNHLNRFLCDHSEVGRYATMFFGVIHTDGTLEFIKAGHPSPLLLRGGEVSDLYTGGSFPVGLLPEATYTSSTVKLQLDDTLVLFSDGITEAEDSEDNLFGVLRLREVLMGQQSAPLDHLQRLALESVERFTGCASQSDDRTLLLVRYRGPFTSDSGSKSSHLEDRLPPATLPVA